MPANVTREHKLALIIGFSLVLVVGVLISDHFSKARSQQVATEITPGSESVFGTGTQDLRVVTAAPTAGPTITTDPAAAMAGGVTPTAPLPGIEEPRFSAPGPAEPAIVMGEPVGGSSIVDRVINNSPSIPLVGNTVVPDAGGVRPIGRDGQPAPLPLSTGPGAAPTPESATVALAPPPAPREDQINGVPRSLMKRHDVREGESIYRIAQNAYGDGKLWNKLIDFNKGKIAPNGSVRQGVTLLLPPREVLLGKPLPTSDSDAARKPSTPPSKPQGRPEPSRVDPQPERALASAKGKTYVVQRGDSLSDIAKKTLGSARRWNEIVDLNRDVLDDENNLIVGLTLKLPSR